MTLPAEYYRFQELKPKILSRLSGNLSPKQQQAANDFKITVSLADKTIETLKGENHKLNRQLLDVSEMMLNEAANKQRSQQDENRYYKELCSKLKQLLYECGLDDERILNSLRGMR